MLSARSGSACCGTARPPARLPGLDYRSRGKPNVSAGFTLQHTWSLGHSSRAPTGTAVARPDVRLRGDSPGYRDRPEHRYPHPDTCREPKPHETGNYTAPSRQMAAATAARFTALRSNPCPLSGWNRAQNVGNVTGRTRCARQLLTQHPENSDSSRTSGILGGRRGPHRTTATTRRSE
jgi:hypothetical protein